MSSKTAGTNLANTTNQRTFNFKVRVLAQKATEEDDFGDDLYKDVELSHDEFVAQWAITLMVQLNGKLDGIHRQAYISV